MFKSGIIVMIITMLSRILGLGRTAIIASTFGASALTDAYFSAFKIANLFRQLLGEGALGTVFIPVYNDKIKEAGEKEAFKLMFSILNLLFFFLVIIFLFSFFFSSSIIDIIVKGYDAETKKNAAIMLRAMSSYIVFIGMSGMICAILNNYKKFAIAASTSIFFNAAIIGSAYFLNGELGIFSLCIGVVAGGVLQFLIVLPSFFKIIKKYSFKINMKDSSLKLIFIMILPMLLGIFARQFNTVIDQFFASYLDKGGVSALENATRIYNLPLGVFGISIATVVYPTLSKAVSAKNEIKAKESIESGLKLLMFLVLPSITALCFFSKEIVDLILGYGNFTSNSINITGEALTFYSIGLFFYTANHILNRAFYSRKNTKDPVKFSIITIIINIVLNALLIKTMAHKGLALATSIASGVNFLLLYYYHNRAYTKLDYKNLMYFGLKICLSCLIAFTPSYFIQNSIIKLGSFGLVYLGFWAYPLKKGGLDFFGRTKSNK